MFKKLNTPTYKLALVFDSVTFKFCYLNVRESSKINIIV